MSGMRVLLVAYDFPPVGGIGVQRAVKFARYLPEFGIEPIVLSNRHGLGWLRDDELLARNELAGLRVIRAGGSALTPYHHWRNGAGAFPWRQAPTLLWSMLRYGDLYGSWFGSLRRQLPGLLRDERIDGAWTTVPHASTCHFGLQARAAGLPWVVDIRDSMVNNPDLQVMAGLASVQAARLRRLERQVVAGAGRVCAVSQAIIDNMVARCGESYRDRFILLPNGFDRADFPPLAPPPAHGKLCFLFAGTFTGRRRPDVLVAGINHAVSHGLLDPTQVRFDFYGRFQPDVDAVLAGIDPRVESHRHGFVSQSQAIAATRGADVVLIITSPGNHPAAQEVITGKVFECMGLAKRVLALTDAEPLRGLIAEAALGEACSAADPAAVASALAALAARRQRGESLAIHPRAEVVARYERRAQAATLADTFHQLRKECQGELR